MRPPITKPPAGANRTEGSQQTQPQCSNDSLRGTCDATEQRIAELQTAQKAALAAGDKATFKKLFDEWNAARAARTPQQLHQLDEKHRAVVDTTDIMGRHGFYAVPTAWVATAAKRVAPWRTSRPVDAKADSRGAA